MKAKKCKVCGKEFIPRYSAVQMVCGKPCEWKYRDRAIEEVKSGRHHKRKKAEYIQKNDSKRNKSLLQKSVNAIARSIDRGFPCLATGNSGQIQGGHVFSRGGHTQMRFNLHNIHRQSAASNNHQGHDGLMQEKLEIEYGTDYLNFLRKLRGTPVIKYSAAEYYSFYLKANEILRNLEAIDQHKFTKNQRIQMRNRINQQLNIYQEGLVFV